MIDANDNNDHKFMAEIMEKANLNRTVLLPGNLSASQYKGYVSKCEMLIAARTHATIGAYSNCVPVFALSYSIKARGIAKDLFGKELCVKSITEINSADALFDCFTELETNREQMRSVLAEVIPAKKELCFAAGEALKEYI
jgi:polysaccharide pyruvyl transferase WcaK-like protein